MSTSLFPPAASSWPVVDRGGVVGVDPGQSGGIAYVFVPAAASPGTKVVTAAAWKMPETERDVWELLLWLSKLASCAFVEAVGVNPKHGAGSAAKFMRGYGGLRMALTAAGYSWFAVAPRKWQKDLGCLTGGDKNVSKAAAQRAFPDLKMTHALADALLIAWWGFRTRRREKLA